ncbi:MAG: hypothetical protein PUF66_02445 [Clostridium sp.]|nr:hypothetical protein [Clostridium sp.]
MEKENFKTEFGESKKDLRERTFNALMNVLKGDDKKSNYISFNHKVIFAYGLV